jgi:RNA-binding proteins (RRM domain)
VNTAVWVTKIPGDAELSEIQDLFSKYGILAEELDTGKPRIKMYTDENGNFNGEALVVYFRPESVKLAIDCLDETDFRLGPHNPAGPMRVQAADFSSSVKRCGAKGYHDRERKEEAQGARGAIK